MRPVVPREWNRCLEIIDRLQGDDVDEADTRHAMYNAAQALQQNPFSAAVQAASSALPTQAKDSTARLFGRSIKDWFRIQTVLSAPSVFQDALSGMGPGASVDDLLQHVNWASCACTLDEDGEWFVTEVLLQDGESALAKARRVELRKMREASQRYQDLTATGTTVLVYVVPARGGRIQTLDGQGALRALRQSAVSKVTPTRETAP